MPILPKLLLITAAAFAIPAYAEPQDLKFREFFAGPIGRAGLALTPQLLAANNTQVRITGYMVAEEDAPTGRFFLTPRPVRMSEHADGEADDLPPNTVTVFMPAHDRSRAIPHTPGLMQLTGTLRVGRAELDDGRVTWVRLELDPPQNKTQTSALTVPGAQP